ncbi:hypothetical protein ASD79_02895 [Caulobacter sp. Root655]|uniref:hypothetical protein n=1 Tax=Caulobacter sp. Root655 TaxID=1736578 RepID=UPI0006FBFDB0|nr:hypothetical protein [Caulobacter sp. Root655]KRA66243.1 hypothetical protein ASD79_02895 [Caulobacter sp. Root655]
MLKPALSLLLAALVTTSCALSAKATPGAEETSAAPAADLCEILENPGKFAEKRVSIVGMAVTDYREFSGVGSEACGGRYLPFGGSKRPFVGEDAFEQALQSVRVHPDQQVKVTVVGVVHAYPGKIPNVTLATEGFHAVSVVPKPVP